MYGVLGNGVYIRKRRWEAKIEIRGLRKHAFGGRGLRIRRSVTSIH